VRLVIFGAGASYDSVDLEYAAGLGQRLASGGVHRPPLANQLFDERQDFITAMNKWSEMAGLVPRLRQAVVNRAGPSIEETLREIQDEADEFPWRRAHLLALRHYLSEILDRPCETWLEAAGRATNYAGLVDQLGQRRGRDSDPNWLFVTFNHDRLLEAAMRDIFGWRIGETFDDYLLGDFALIKPHGSVGWWQHLVTPMGRAIEESEPHRLINLAARAEFRTDAFLVEGVPRSGAWQPAIAIPVDRTKSFVCPEDHLARMRRDLERVTSILIVGWRGSEQHFLDVMYEHLPKNRVIPIYIVDYASRATSDLTAGGYAVRQALNEALGEAVSFDFTINNDGFSSFVSNRVAIELPG
jgi:hypothetical protein